MCFGHQETVSVTFGDHPRHKGLLLHSGLGAEGGGYIMQIPHLIPLVGGKGYGLSEESLHLHIGRSHQCAGDPLEVNGLLPLIDMEGKDLGSIYSSGSAPAWSSKALLSCGGSALPLALALRRIPKQAGLLK